MTVDFRIRGVRARLVPNDDRYAVDVRGNVWSRAIQPVWYLVKQQNQKGYLYAYVSGKRRRVHCLVMLAFAGPCPLRHEVNHRDGNTTNNRRRNLRYVTKSENVQHAWRVLKRKQGMSGKFGLSHNRSKVVDIVEVRRLRCCGLSYARIAVQVGVDYKTVWRICHGCHWQVREKGD